jgi:anti-sigma regulatory factor (Ser/Thr protein kinase)
MLERINAFLDTHGISPRLKNATNLVLEEAITNVIRHGCSSREQHRISAHLRVDDEEIAIRLEDDGKPFNPLTVPRLDPSVPAPERAEEGLGLHLVRHMMRAMTYRRLDQRNVFEIWVKR